MGTAGIGFIEVIIEGANKGDLIVRVVYNSLVPQPAHPCPPPLLPPELTHEPVASSV
jgi:hypothetical protein